MYESHFQLRSRPFPPAADAQGYVGVGPIEQARQTLSRVVERASGPAMIIGGTGTGKSMLCEKLALQFQGRLRVALVTSGQFGSGRALLQTILFELGLSYRNLDDSELRLSLAEFLTQAENQDGLLLIIDEAHSLPLSLLEEVRTITNLVRDGQARVRLVLAGSTELEERFTNPKLDSFNQRIAARCYLESLNREETYAFIGQQIAAAGGQASVVFPHEAQKAVYDATDGVPRLVNQLCDHALIMAALGKHRVVNAAIVQEAWADLQQLPTPWVEPQPAVAQSQAAQQVVEFGDLSDEEESEPASIPFPSQEQQADLERQTSLLSEIASQGAGDPQRQLDMIERQVAEASLDHPAEEAADGSADDADDSVLVRVDGQGEPAHPFSDTFEVEELVVDEYATLDELRGATAGKVSSRASSEIAAMLAGKEVADAPEGQTDQGAADDETAPPPAADTEDLPVDSLIVAMDPGDYDQSLLTDAVAALLGDQEAEQHLVAEELTTATSGESNVKMPAALRQDDSFGGLGGLDPHGDDRDVIIVHHEPSDVQSDDESSSKLPPRPQKYRQLFARLRQA